MPNMSQTPDISSDDGAARSSDRARQDRHVPADSRAAGHQPDLRQVRPQAGEEDDPTLTGAIPQPTTGEERWIRDDLGALGSEGGHDWTNQSGTVTGPTPSPQRIASQRPSGGMSEEERWPQTPMSPGWSSSRGTSPPDSGGMPLPARPLEKPTEGDEGFVEQGVEGALDEAYGQGMTRQFAPRGAEPGIDQQEELQSRQYQREERVSTSPIDETEIDKENPDVRAQGNQGSQQ